MHFTEEQTALLKTWVIKKLEDISDADADVLADYALALVSTEDAEEVAKANTLDNLKDFLPSNAEQFVDELFQAIASKSYDPNAPKSPPAPPVPQLPTGPKNAPLGPMHDSRKRSFQWDGEDAFGQNGHAQGGNRPIKHMKRGGRGGFDRGGRQQAAPIPPYTPQHFSQTPPVPNWSAPQNLPPFDHNMMMVMQQFVNSMSGGSPPNGLPFAPPISSQRCRDYDTKGFCTAGASCPYEHGSDRLVFPSQNQQYDPTNAMLGASPSGSSNFNAFQNRGGGARGRGRGTSNFRGGGKRSDFSQLGPNRDSTNTSIVVEQIPADKLDEQTVYDFFSDFGSVQEVTMHPDRKLAIVTFADNPSAKAAYESPKVVFDNRFVKVYWYKTERFERQQNGSAYVKPSKALDVEMQDDEQQQANQAKLAKRQEEAQRKHDEARCQREEAEKQKSSLDQKLKTMEAERKKMEALLAKKSGKSMSPAADSPTQNGDSEQTKGLRAQLARLEAEAKSLGIDPNAPPTNGYDGYNGYNSYQGYNASPYRGRGGYRGRGRGHYQPYRGARGGGAVMRLDNRPKTIAVTFTNPNYDANDEALRQFLLFNSIEAAEITKHPEKENTALVTFKQRYEGENFLLAAGAEIPHAGKVEASWYSGPSPVKSNGAANGEREREGVWDVSSEGGGEGDAGDREMFDAEEQDLDRYA